MEKNQMTAAEKLEIAKAEFDMRLNFAEKIARNDMKKFSENDDSLGRKASWSMERAIISEFVLEDIKNIKLYLEEYPITDFNAFEKMISAGVSNRTFAIVKDRVIDLGSGNFTRSTVNICKHTAAQDMLGFLLDFQSFLFSIEQ